MALLTACGTPLPHERPALDVPAAYKQGVQGSAVWQTAQPQDSVPSAWWTLFADPALNALQERAASGNQNVALAVARLRGRLQRWAPWRRHPSGGPKPALQGDF